MKIPGVSVEYWQQSPHGGMRYLGDLGDAAATMARVLAPGVAAEPLQFLLPEERGSLDYFLRGLSHGFAIGREHQRAEIRKAIGVEVIKSVAASPALQREG
jgi:hypothetical protein